METSHFQLFRKKWKISAEGTISHKDVHDIRSLICPLTFKSDANRKSLPKFAPCLVFHGPEDNFLKLSLHAQKLALCNTVWVLIQKVRNKKMQMRLTQLLRGQIIARSTCDWKKKSISDF